MKRWEGMSREEIMDVFNKPFELRSTVSCLGCPLWDWELKKHIQDHRCEDAHLTCTEILRQWLNEEVETKKRWQLPKSDEDVRELIAEWLHSEEDEDFADWICEEVEA